MAPGPLDRLPRVPVTPPRRGPPEAYPFAFEKSRKETPSATTFSFSTVGTSFQYRSNQAVRIVLPQAEDPRPWRMFSMSSSPSESGRIAVTVKMTGSGFKRALANLTPGEKVTVQGPVGDLFYDASRPAVFIAGGIGVTPFRGMLRYAADTHAKERRVLLYSVKVPEEFAFKAEIDEIARAHSETEVVYTVTRPEESDSAWSGRTGRIDETLVREALEGMERPKVYVAGLPEMAQETLAMLRSRLGISEDDLEYEYFLGY